MFWNRCEIFSLSQRKWCHRNVVSKRKGYYLELLDRPGISLFPPGALAGISTVCYFFGMNFLSTADIQSEHISVVRVN